MFPREIVERLGGFCRVEHKHQWMLVVIILPLCENIN
jgi:hypothetical protein